MNLPNPNKMTIKCIRCGTPLIVDNSKVFCDVCDDCLKKPVLNKTINVSPYETNNIVDRWIEKE